MFRDVIDLREFYRARLGQIARRSIWRKVREIWPDVHGLSVVGMGYATPYLRAFADEAAQICAVMPGSQGVVHWPRHEPGRVILADESELPFPDQSIDRVLLIHALECADQLRPMMREIWRIMAGGGRLIAVVPNRTGLWARAERTPFGHGHPYSSAQLTTLLRDTMFMPERTERALFVPPLRSGFLLSSAPAWDRIGERWFGTFAGVYVIEATKQLYAIPRDRQTAGLRRRVLIPVGGQVAGPRPAMGRGSAARDHLHD